jgi:hypothetical protein
VAETVEWIADMVDSVGDLVVSDVWENSWQITNELMDKIKPVFELTEDPAYADLKQYGKNGYDGPGGSLSTYAGPEMDWLVHSWIGDFQRGFVNCHVTAYLGPHIDVPHLGIAFGTSRTPWFYLDTPTRRDCNTEIEYFDKYIAPRNDHYLEVRTDPRCTAFVSRDPYIRQVLTDVCLCSSMENIPPNWDYMREEAHKHVDMWLGWVEDATKNGPAVPLEEREELAQRDLVLRRTICERDPANSLASTREFPPGYEEILVRALWGAERTLPRPLER